jgi:hypothetical protein
MLYSPHCGHCHKMVPQFNSLRDALTAGGLKNIEIVAVDVSQEFSSLRAGGISVPHVPLVLIKTPTSIIEYQGNRMATEIASEAAKVLAGGESVPATVPATVAAPADALLGGAVESVEGGARTVGAMKRRSKGKRRPSPSQRRGYRSPHRYASGVDRSASRVRKQHSVRRKSKKTGKVSRFMRYSARRSASRINRSRALRQLGLRVKGGEQIEGGDVEGGEYRVISGRYPSGVDRSPSRKRHMVADYHVRGHWSKTRSGKKVWVKPFDVRGRQTSRRSRASIRRSRSKRPLKPYRSRAIRGGEVEVKGGEVEVKGGAAAPEVIAGGDLEGGKRRRSRRRSRSRRSRVRGGDVDTMMGGEVEGGDIEGGKKHRSRSRTAWQRLMSSELKKVSPGKTGFRQAVRAAKAKYYK